MNKYTVKYLYNEWSAMWKQAEDLQKYLNSCHDEELVAINTYENKNDKLITFIITKKEDK